MTHPALPRGGLLSIDWGKKKVGYATVDDLGLAITPQGSFVRKTSSQTWDLGPNDLNQIKSLIEKFEPGALVLGLPVNTQGIETDAAKGARDLAAKLKKEFSMEVFLVNEVLTSWDSRSAKNEDAAAAALLIEDFLEQQKRSSRKNNSGSIKTFLLLILVLVLAAGGFGAKLYYDFALKPVSAESSQATSEIIVDVPPQSSLGTLRASLAKLGVPINKIAFKAWVLTSGSQKKLHVGEYKIQLNWTPLKILSEVLTGQSIMHAITIKEGHSIYDISTAVQSGVFVNKTEDFLGISHDPKLLKKMQVPDLPSNHSLRSLEGYLFPETYNYQKYDTPRKVIEAMMEQFERRALPILEQHPWGKTPEGRYRLLTLASVVEKESGQASEQPLIASVFWNRLAKKMRLQSDPTTIYGLMPNFDGNLKRIHLTTPSPYNTYTQPELPAGPICNPGETAIKAVVQAPQTKYLYFVGKGDGSHAFSEDYKTHTRYVKFYQLHQGSLDSPPTSKKKQRNG